ncbi:DUF2889 domain-containing protein [Dechloromonas agitata]|uniref:DUF2889 domain-containing protein n=1 Tax=Dechloromonas agitata TaxID=73030 RepID=UPI00237E8B79|nr:DUF2889 domain-containing protein [Dechloromonas agitata]MDE1544016.1 DUF2889 domain-containing protein [Dechloromonas agitata]
MDFSPPVTRKLLHRRSILCEGYEREDGLWDIEAQLLDTRSFELPLPLGATLAANEPLHQMGLRIAVDRDSVIREVEPLTAHGPSPECRDISDAYRQLLGLRIAPGFASTVKRLFGGRLGCTHLTDLLGPLATTAMQTLWAAQIRNAARGDKTPIRVGDPKTLIDSCHAFRSDGEIARVHWPDSYTGAK